MTQAKNYNLDSVALLVEFNASVWTAKKLDKTKTAEVVDGAGAKNKGAARVNKSLMAGRPELENISALVTQVRSYVYDNTLPWSNNGQRLLITARLPAFDAKMQGYIEEFNALVAAFTSQYSSLITAQAMALGNMFNRAEFPLTSEITKKFAMSCEYLPVPVAGDIRVDISDQAQDELRARLEHMASLRVEKAVADINEKLAAHMARMVDRLTTDVDPVTKEEKPRRFTETLVSGAMELCDLIADYNITGDPKLEHARRLLESKLAGVTVENLRDDPAKRDDVREAVKGILDKFSFGSPA